MLPTSSHCLRSRFMPPKAGGRPRRVRVTRRKLIAVPPRRFGDAGMVTAEAAVVLPVLVFVLAAALAAVSVVTAQMRCTDAAREGARAAARGESDAAVQQIATSSAPEGSSVTVTRDGDTATVRVTASVALFPGLGPAMTVSDSATAALEPGLDEPASALRGSGSDQERGRDTWPAVAVGRARWGSLVPRPAVAGRPGGVGFAYAVPHRDRRPGEVRTAFAVPRRDGQRAGMAADPTEASPWGSAGSADRGSAGVWVLALSGVVLLAGAASVLAGLAIVSRHEAGTAADLAALAAASRALSGSEVACSRADEIALVNGADLTSCSLSSDGVVDVAVTVTVQFGSLGVGVAHAQARAGPAGPGVEATEDSAEPGLTGQLPHVPDADMDQLLRPQWSSCRDSTDRYGGCGQRVEDGVQDRDRRLLVQRGVAVAALR